MEKIKSFFNRNRNEITNEISNKLAIFNNLNAIVKDTTTVSIEKTKKTEQRLLNVPFGLKDNFATQGIETSAGCDLLKNFVPNYNATVFQTLINEGAYLIGKTTLDELAMGGTGLHSNTGIVRNPLDLSRICGGSSGGSAAVVGAGIVPFAIGSDTGDSIRRPASFCGVCGFKPTWGGVSRWGLYDFSPSFDTVGWFTNNVSDAALLFNILKGHDKKDFSSYPHQIKNVNLKFKKQKIAIIEEIYNDIKNKDLKKAFDEVIEKLKKTHTVEFVSFPNELLQAMLPCYRIIVFAEASSCNSNLDGINFGNRVEGENYIQTMINTRTKGFGLQVKKRFIVGAYSLLKENQKDLYLKAKQIRTLLIQKCKEIFADFDSFILPASNNIAPKISDIKNNENNSKDKSNLVKNGLLIANFTGIPSITIPLTTSNNMPIGINVNSNLFDENSCFQLAHDIEKLTNE